jgi:hypothetical protein
MSLVCFWIYGQGRRRHRVHNAAALFFLLGFLLSVLLLAYWGISHPGFPEFSELGWI